MFARLSPLVLVALALVPAVAAADASGDLAKVKNAFFAAKSFEGTEQMPDGRTVKVDYVAPDRWRVALPNNMTELLIGDTVYMTLNGKTMTVPIGSGIMHQTIDGFKNMPADAEFKSSAKDLGMKSVGGKMLHAYSFTSKGVPATVYVGSNWLPVQTSVTTQHGPITITYSRWNDPTIVIHS